MATVGPVQSIGDKGVACRGAGPSAHTQWGHIVRSFKLSELRNGILT